MEYQIEVRAYITVDIDVLALKAKVEEQINILRTRTPEAFLDKVYSQTWDRLFDKAVTEKLDNLSTDTITIDAMSWELIPEEDEE